MSQKLKNFWQREKRFTLITLNTVGLIYIFIRLIQFSTTTKLLLGFVALLLLIALIGGTTVIGTKKKAKEDDEEEKKIKGDQLLAGILRNTPANMIWVTRRSVFGSDIESQDLEGYRAQKEGWGYYVPYYHEDLGFVDLSPIPRDPESITVNTSDNQTAIVDWRIETFVPDDNSAIILATKVDGNREEFEDKKAIVILNQICSEKTQDDLTRLDPGELKQIGDDTKDRFNNEMKDLGIRARALEIKKILMPEEIRAAAEYKTVTEIRKKVAAIKAEELETIINATKANATKVVVTEMVRDMLTNIADVFVNALRTHQETKEDKDE